MNKEEMFTKELSYIKNNKYRDNLKIMISMLPDYFFEVAAASTGKYHPESSLGIGGLYRHTKTVARIAYELYSNECITDIFTDDEKDMMLFAIVLHDGLKHGIIKNEYVVFDHPLVMCKFIVDNKDKLTLNEEEIKFITDSIATHMGPFVVDYRGNEILKKPTNKYQKFVHMCDYLASRKFLDIKFENNEIIN